MTDLSQLASPDQKHVYCIETNFWKVNILFVTHNLWYINSGEPCFLLTFLFCQLLWPTGRYLVINTMSKIFFAVSSSRAAHSLLVYYDSSTLSTFFTTWSTAELASFLSVHSPDFVLSFKHAINHGHGHGHGHGVFTIHHQRTCSRPSRLHVEGVHFSAFQAKTDSYCLCCTLSNDFYCLYCTLSNDVLLSLLHIK